MATRAYSGIVTPESNEDLVAVRDSFLKYGPEVQKRMEDAGRAQLTAAWTDELSHSSGISAQQASIVKALPLVGVAGPSVVATTGGVGPLGFLTKQFEFGADREVYKPQRYPHRKSYSGMKQGPADIQKSGTFQRRTRRQLPPISSTGYIAYPAAGRWSTRVYAMYLDITVLVAHQAAEGDIRG
jgi:hypothetical protein